MSDWQTELQQAYTRPADLLAALGLADERWSQAAHEQFPLRVPKAFAARMRPGDRHDPLLRQVLPVESEVEQVDGFVLDPVGDLPSKGERGLLHKYSSRVLLITTGACAVHCRYCFRRHFPYAQENPRRDWQALVSYLRANPEVNEVILSGGDPLSLSDARVAELLDVLRVEPQIKRVRLHTRQLVVLPSRLTNELLAQFKQLQAAGREVIVVMHINHANEVDEAVRRTCQMMKDAGVTLLNQSVLLRGVNDNADTLTELSESLFNAGVLPYYISQLDKVQGAHHFEVPLAEGLQLIKQIRARLPGYLVPSYVEEVAGAESKLPL